MSAACDVIIVGAGAAGLAALQKLHAAGVDVRCLEARSRVGGRILTLHDPAAPVPIELGAEFVHGRPPEIWDLAEQTALPLSERNHQPAYLEHGRIRDDEIGGRVQQVLSDLETEAQRDADQTFDEFLQRSSYPEDTKRWAAAYVEGFNAARKEQIGIAALAQDAQASERIDGDRLFAITTGYDSLIRALQVPNLNEILSLNTIVDHVEWKLGRVTLHTYSPASGLRETMACRRAIFTLPIGVLQTAMVHFDPPPGRILDAAAALRFGAAWRVTIHFASAFWERTDKLANAGFFYTQQPVFPTWWKPDPGAPLITGWSAGPAADALAGLSNGEITKCAIATLERIVGERASPVRAAYLHDWQSDPFSRGAYSYAPAGHLSARDILAQPVCDTLYFAGEATENEGHSATVHGAIASGRRAARQLLGN